MSLFTYLSSADNVLELFESVVTGIMVMDKEYHVLMVNRAARNFLGQSPNCLSGKLTCYSLLYKRDSPCDDCPLEEMNPVPGRLRSLTVTRDNGSEILLKISFSEWFGHIVFTMHDVTREVNLLREVDLGRKELQAKNVIIERRRQEVLTERKYLEALWNHLPDALVTVNESFSIDRRNQAVEDLFHSSGSKCHELVGNVQPCEGCPAQNGFELLAEHRKSHKIGDQYVTETITRSPSQKGGLLIFRDTTRQIQLIEKIRDQQAAITRKNQILSGLVDFSARMQMESQMTRVAEIFLDLFLPVMEIDTALLFINDIRPGNIWVTAQRGFSEDSITSVSRAYLSRAVQSDRTAVIEPSVLPWPAMNQTILVGGGGQRVGHLILNRQLTTDDELRMVTLFTEQIGAYIHNQLLMRQLEERANTDPLTGLYNRGYLEQAMSEEKAKLSKFGINFAVVVADVNRLKMANDLYGHEAGDLLIVTVSKLFKKASRLTDIVARTGGDEFLILLTDSTDESAGVYVERLKEKIFNDAFMTVGQEEKFPVTVSLGCAGTDRVAPENLTKEADRLMYQDKEEYYKNNKRYR